MSATGDTIAAIEGLVDRLDEATTAANAAISEADDGRNMAEAIGHPGIVAAFSEVHDLIEQAQNLVGQAVDRANEAIERTKAIEGG